jgi:hypothetical protein
VNPKPTHETTRPILFSSHCRLDPPIRAFPPQISTLRPPQLRSSSVTGRFWLRAAPRASIQLASCCPHHLASCTRYFGATPPPPRSWPRCSLPLPLHRHRSRAMLKPSAGRQGWESHRGRRMLCSVSRRLACPVAAWPLRRAEAITVAPAAI